MSFAAISYEIVTGSDGRTVVPSINVIVALWYNFNNSKYKTNKCSEYIKQDLIYLDSKARGVMWVIKH